ncbi:MAG TPA: hypothetical protein ENG40_03650 [Thermoprotei archaeon]|nr:hypothetical protein [Thermoprotei archaeon]
MKVFVFGIDSAEPNLVFDKWLGKLPTLKEMVSEGAWGKIASTVPPITCPAWPASLSGLNPGWFGLYDLRYRKPKSYLDFGIVNSKILGVNRVWDFLTKTDMKSGVTFVPVTYPPTKVNGFMVSSFLTPSVNSMFTYPKDLREDILKISGGKNKYIIDVYDYRRKDPKQLFEELSVKTRQDFKIIRYLLDRYKDLDFFMTVIMTVDRAQHTLWKFFDKDHPRYIDDPELRDGLYELHRQIDEEIGETLKYIPSDAAIIIISDHGAKRMLYRINMNEILIEEGYLKVKKKFNYPISLKYLDEKGYIDWSKTKAFALGAYIGQIFLNLEGREPKGIVKKTEYEDIREEISNIFKDLRGPNGERLDNRIFLREEVYHGSKINRMPDITIYFDNLHYGANESIGFNSIYSLETVKGPDDSNHGEYGIFILKDPEERVKGKIDGLKLEDLMPTILRLLDINIPENIDGKSIV